MTSEATAHNAAALLRIDMVYASHSRLSLRFLVGKGLEQTATLRGPRYRVPIWDKSFQRLVGGAASASTISKSTFNSPFAGPYELISLIVP